MPSFCDAFINHHKTPNKKFWPHKNMVSMFFPCLAQKFGTLDLYMAQS